ncbi:MAG TPA: hypothetical protein VEG63_05450 [Candidatus Acidoferrales bacterium]|nr:hypothetical protein [Candidatus Acidoferrales bacterium]
MTKSRQLAILSALLAVLSAAAAQKLPWRAKEEDALGGATRVLLVPPEVHVEKWTVTTGTETTGTADHLRRTICGEMDDLFEQRKLLVSEYPLCLGEGETTMERQDALLAVQARFRDLVTAWSKPGHRNDLLESFRLVEELPITKKMDVDVLILVTADGTLTSKGEKAMSSMGGLMGGGGQGLMIHFGVIRAQTGELLFFSEKYVGGDFLKHPEGLEKAIQKSVQAAFAPQPHS